jgi:hypothetical protein
MTPEQYKAAATAISDLRWILAAALSSASIEHTKESKVRMKQLNDLREALELEGMKGTGE